jgi:hypothetical protein
MYIGRGKQREREGRTGTRRREGKFWEGEREDEEVWFWKGFGERI